MVSLDLTLGKNPSILKLNSNWISRNNRQFSKPIPMLLSPELLLDLAVCEPNLDGEKNMPQVLCKFKNFDDFYGSYSSLWSQINSRVGLNSADKGRFDKAIFQGKGAMRQSYDNHVDAAPELAKARTQIETVEKKKKAALTYANALSRLDSEISAKKQMLDVIESRLVEKKLDPKKDQNFIDSQTELKKLIKARPVVAKKKLEYDKLAKLCDDVTKAYDKLKKDVSKKIEMSVQYDKKNLLVYIGKKAEASVKLVATLKFGPG
ncbi:hypothetical protein [Pseudovibrio sp. Tun.PSC04-5.I4]|uniref:hypothetical protein n=1 Tax=Pseudovibrio sp. Tun.PSC04-5.I4 TaxID=1798213 RepID=UPI00088A001C|nr:hypothetical protein [Pseudovibrio sp. Tun.PSC04-5.I4]SDR35918.1 hypothetical protein SAMN04515695_4915 [Pseudovibrio sp. Tun.PSC04-5.I4]